MRVPSTQNASTRVGVYSSNHAYAFSFVRASTQFHLELGAELNTASFLLISFVMQKKKVNTNAANQAQRTKPNTVTKLKVIRKTFEKKPCLKVLIKIKLRK